MQSQTFNLPTEMNNVVSATIADTVNGDILFCHDQAFLYAAKIAKVGGSVIFQRFNLPNLIKIIPVIKNYFMALFSSSKLVVFEVWFNEDNKVMLKYVFNKADKPCISYFLREVVENMAELQLLYPDNEIYIYQFTVNGKVGHMEYVIGPQNKIKAERAQLYGSKTIVCPQRKIYYYFSSFSSKVVNSINLAKLESDLCEQSKTSLLAYICLPKIEEHYLILANLNVVNITNPGNRHRIQISEAYQQDFMKLIQRKTKPTFKISTYFDMLLIQDSELLLAAIVQIRQKGSCLIAVEYGNFNWFWTSTRKLVGFSPTRNSFRMIESLKMNQKSNSLMEESPGLPQKLNPIKQFKSQDNIIFKQENNEDLSKKWKQYTQKILSDTSLPSQFMENLNQSRQKIPQQPETQSVISQPVQPPNNKIEEPSFIEKVTLPEKFVPTKVIQKKGVNVSKSINKPKEIEPMSKGPSQQPQISQNLQKIQTTQPALVEPKVSPAELADQQQAEVPATIQKVQQKVEVGQSEQKVEESKSEEVMSRQQHKLLQLLDSKTPIKDEKAVLQVEVQPIVQSLQIPKEEIQKQEESQPKSVQIVEPQPSDGRVVQQITKQDERDKAADSVIQDESLSKNLALMIQRNMAGLQHSTSTINRNKIFKNQVTIPVMPAPEQPKLKQTQSENLQYYNPFLSHSPLSHKEAPADQKEPYNIELPPQEPKDQHNEIVLNKIKELFQSTTSRLLKTLEDIAQTSSLEPYLKEKVRQQIQAKVMDTLRSEIAGPFSKKIEQYFSEIFRQTSAVQEQSIKFYKQASTHKSSLIQVQLNNQEKILKEIKEIESMIRFTVSTLRAESTQTYESIFKSWATEVKETKKIVASLQTFKQQLQQQTEQRNKRYEDTKKMLQEIKGMLAERVTAEEERKEKQLDRKARKIKQQDNKRKKRVVEERGRGGDREKKVRVKKSGDV